MQKDNIIQKLYTVYKQLQRRYKIIFCILLFLFVILFTIIIINITKLNNLLSFTLLDIFDFIVTTIIGFFFTYIVSVSLQKESKQNEIFEECLNNINEDSKKLVNYIENCCNQEISNNIRAHILVMDGILTADVFAFKKFCENKKKISENDLKQLLKTRMNFHVIITGDFLVIGKHISLPYLQKSLQYYYELQQHSLNLKLKLINS